MWQPEPGWRRLPGAGPSTVGTWQAVVNGRDVVVKRLAAPAAHDPGDYSRPRHPAWWRRPADVALDGLVERTPGLRSAEVLRVDEDDEGITLTTALVPPVAASGLFLAHSLGRFAGAALPDRPWLARDLLRTRLRRVEQRGGWTTLARTPVADVADHLWSRRTGFLDALDALPQVPQHGDPVPANLVGRDGDDVVAIDWATLGTGPVGADLGYLSLSTKEGFEPLLTSYVDALPPGMSSPDDAARGARTTAVYTVLTRADWALARVAEGEGALAGKYRHPSVAPYILAMQRQFDQIEALLG